MIIYEKKKLKKIKSNHKISSIKETITNYMILRTQLYL